jgi:ABC-2 type transport system permease protein
MAAPLQDVAYAFPLTYAFDALSRATHSGPLGGTLVLDVAVVIGATLAALALGAATLRRRTP